jgi:hypothetical protein
VLHESSSRFFPVSRKPTGVEEILDVDDDLS